MWTEGEAKKKWCPYARHDTTGGNRTIHNNVGDFSDYAEKTANAFPCIASRCMAWRWSKNLFEFVTLEPWEIPDGEMWEEDSVRYSSDSGPTRPESRTWKRVAPFPRGYCGNAGR